MRDLIKAFGVQKRVISALILRDISSRRGSDAASIGYLFLEPIIITMIVIGIHWVAVGSNTHSIPVAVFLLTGYMPHLLLRHSGLSGISAWNADSGLLYHRQVQGIDLVLARLFVETLIVLIGFIVIYAALLAIGQIGLPHDTAYMFLGWVLHIWIVFALAFILTGLCAAWPLTRRFFQPLILLALPAYGAFFMLSWVPTDFQYWILLFPSADATEIMRRGYFGDAASTFYSIPYTLACCIVLTFFGFVSLLAGRKYVEL